MSKANPTDAQWKDTQVENLCYGCESERHTGWKPVLRMGSGKAHRLKTCATGGSEGLPVPQEPALLTSAAMDGEAKSASSE